MLECEQSKLKNASGRRLTQGLFYEFGNPDAPYTLKDSDFVAANGNTYRSMYDVYMSSTDEYEAAIRSVGSMGHWRMLTSQKWFMEGTSEVPSFEGLTRWRLDMAARDRSLAKQQLMQEAQNGSVTAQKELYQSSGKQLKSPEKTSKKGSQGLSDGNKVRSLVKRFESGGL